MNMIRTKSVCVGLVAGAGLALMGYGVLGSAALTKPTQIEKQVAECIEHLAAHYNNLPPRIYGETMYRYDPETDRCLYRSNFVDTDEGYYFEKFIADAFTGETLARYAELDGRPVVGTLAEFSAALDRSFPE